MRSKINVLYEDSPDNVKWTRCKYPKWEVVLGDPDRVNRPCLMHDTRLKTISEKSLFCERILLKHLSYRIWLA